MKLILITLLTWAVFNRSVAFTLHTKLSSTVAQRAFGICSGWNYQSDIKPMKMCMDDRTH